MIFSTFSILAKIFSKFFRTLKIGQGTTIVSNVYLKYFRKNISFDKFKFKNGVVFVTGTNGKSTTSKLISDIFTFLGYKVLHNKTGGNILRSILGMFLIEQGRVKNNEYDILVLEVDEGSIVEMSKYFKVDVLVLLNFSKDQLDRYYEIENLTNGIKDLLKKNPLVNIVYNSEDPSCCEIVEDLENVKLSFKKNLDLLNISNINEEYMAWNLSAASKLMAGFGYYPKDYLSVLRSIKNPYGRGESLQYKKTKIKLYLVKNPNSFNNNLIEFAKKNPSDNYLISLNDNDADGKDISWIYDIEPYLIYEVFNEKSLYFTGKRSYEMANRITMPLDITKKVIVKPKLKEMFTYLEKQKCFDIVILCNYTSMLEIRKFVTGRSILWN